MTSLSRNVKFSIEKNTENGSFVVRSKTESFNLEHIVDKDLVSFYGELSKYGIVDTGILPLSGSGVLAIRSAGYHTQITFQHAPQINYINWGDYEGDKYAKTYRVAQPYRIWIGDTIDGNLYGARMFYSIHPITSASQVLYHLNLPNTNCEGYRGNGVGWQCLYHKDDWTGLPLNEKIIRFAERCSGVETFNDQNMSETDGPRFYASYYENNEDYEYLWNPGRWQMKTEQEGLDWVFDQNLWIPVLVKGLDVQDKHYGDGEPLTLGMAMVGDYQAYYNDNYRPKPINALARPDLFKSITSETIASWVIRSHNSSKSHYVPIDSNKESEDHRKKIVLDANISDSQEEDDEDEDVNVIKITCPVTGEDCVLAGDEGDVLCDSLDNSYCSPCFEENVVYCENTDSSLPSNHESVHYHSATGEYFDVRDLCFGECPECASFLTALSEDQLSNFLYSDKDGTKRFCVKCSSNYLSEKISDYYGKCSHCSTYIPVNANGNVHPDWNHLFVQKNNVHLFANEEIVELKETYCPQCYDTAIQCPTGHMVWFPLAKLPVPIKMLVHHHGQSGVQQATITHLCASCANPDVWQDGLTLHQINSLSTIFSLVTKAEERFMHSYNNGINHHSLYVKYSGDINPVESKEEDKS
jgi:hypothetical protein